MVATGLVGVIFFSKCKSGFDEIWSLSGTSSFSKDTVRFTVVSAHACYNGNFGI